MNDAPFFIVGAGRSGSTLLRAILGSHSRLWIPPETWYLLPLLAKFPISQPLSDQQIDDATHLISTHYRWPDMGLDASQFCHEAKRLATPMLRDVVELVYQKQLDRERKVRWGDKTPGYVEIIPSLISMFPDAQFIHCVRDGRDVAKSFQARKWQGPWLHENAGEWVMAMQCNEKWAEAGLSRRILQLHYEDLIVEPEKTVRAACAFIGEEFETGMLNWTGAVDRIVPVREVHVHQKLKSALTPDSVYRWRREMSRREIFVCEAFMGRYLRQLSYDIQFRSRFWMPIFWITRLYCRYMIPVLVLPPKALRYLTRRLVRRVGGTPQSNLLH